MESEPDSNFQFPPGFRFHPSDEELIVHYLQKKVTSRPLPASVIAEIDLYKYNPWELPKKALFGEDEWYFFSPRDRKYPNGVRPNRAAGSGYWKATGTDKPILTSCGSKSIGVKKALVFHISQSPKGFKTGWIMNEYRLLDTMIRPSRLKGTMRLDDWVLCRVRRKGNFLKKSCEGQESPTAQSMKYLPFIEESPPTFTNNTGVFMDYLSKGCPLLATILGGQPLPPVQTISSVSLQGSNKSSSVYDDGLHTSPIIVSSFDGLFNPLKGKQIKENIHENLQSKKTLTSDKKYEILPEKMMVNTDINFYSNQSQEDIFNSNPSNPIINLQQLQDQLAFTERYLQE